QNIHTKQNSQKNNLHNQAKKMDGKKFTVESYAELLSKIPGKTPVIMGTPKDFESVELVRLLEQKCVPVISAVGSWNLKEVAQIISGAWRYLGNDTGLGHLAEAVGVPSFVVFGPTREDMGFGPWRPESRAIGKSLACRPCGKDGRYCYRLGQRFACMTGLKAQDVILQAPELAALAEKKELSRST
ncbi:MAG: glycosyltransferase family 9 protein, partial [Bdellovibrionia bacterium]